MGTSVTSIRGVLFVQIHIQLRLFVGWFRIGKSTLRIDVIGCKYVHALTFIRGVIFVQIYIPLHLFVGWFCNGENTECKLVHPVTSIRGLVFAEN